MKHYRLQRAIQSRKTEFLTITAIMVVSGLAGVVLLRSTQAATYAVSADASGGVVAGNALVATSPGSVSGRAVSFGTNTPPANPPSGGKYISYAAYPGWVQHNIPPQSIDYSAWTTIDDFGLWPTVTGGIGLGDRQSLTLIPPAVTAAHKANKQINMCIGEEGTGKQFSAASQPQYRTTFVNNLVSYVSKYNYDGIDIDWEENVPENQANYVALVRETRAALDKAFPASHKYLSVDVDTGQIPPAIAKQVYQSVDSVNMMTYWNDVDSSWSAYTAAGIPANKLIVGIGASSAYYDTTADRVADKVKFVESHGAKGTLLWQIGDLNTYKTDPRLVPLRSMVAR